MTQLLIRLFVRHPDDTKNAAVRTAYGNLASLVGMACNLLLCLGKLAAGTLFGSIAIMADALNNLSDASSNVVSLVGFRLAAKGPDEKHPYGHARYEYLAGLVVCVTILAIGLSLLKESALKVLHPTAVVFSWLDVYKRQTCKWSFFRKSRSMLSMMSWASSGSASAGNSMWSEAN